MFSFMDGFSGYNQIKMAPEDAEKTAFRTLSGNFYYTGNFCGISASNDSNLSWYDSSFSGSLRWWFGRKIKIQDRAPTRIEGVFKRCRKFNMRMNPLKCAFRGRVRKVLGLSGAQTWDWCRWIKDPPHHEHDSSSVPQGISGKGFLSITIYSRFSKNHCPTGSLTEWKDKVWMEGQAPNDLWESQSRFGLSIDNCRTTEREAIDPVFNFHRKVDWGITSSDGGRSCKTNVLHQQKSARSRRTLHPYWTALLGTSLYNTEA